MTNPTNHEEFREAIQQVVEYLHDERAHYQAPIQDGQSGTHHIYHALCTLQSWLDVELGHTFDGSQKEDPRIEPGLARQPREHGGVDRGR